MKLYRALLRLYPRAFRERFGDEMLALFAQTAAAAPPTLRGRLALWRAAFADVLPSAARERFSSKKRLSMAPLASDVRQAWRVVRRAPFVTVFVVLLMAISIGSTTAVFSVVHAVLLRPFPFAEPDRLVMVWERQSPENPRNNVGAHEYPEWKARSRSFAGLAAIAFDREYNLTGAGDRLKLVSVRVTSDFFRVMGVAPQAGRALTVDEDEPGRGQVTVISDAFWRSRFGGNLSIVGRPIELNGEPYTVVGVMPAGFEFPSGVGGAPPDAWMPIAEPIQRYRGRHYLAVVGRLRDGVTIAQAQSEMDTIAAGIARELPQFSRGHGVNVQPLHGEIVQGVRRALLVLFAAVALVLTIGCCNVVHLLLARAAGRQQETPCARARRRTRLGAPVTRRGLCARCRRRRRRCSRRGSWHSRGVRVGGRPRPQDARLDGAVLAHGWRQPADGARSAWSRSRRSRA
jgi:putative ABC transport system permease protein